MGFKNNDLCLDKVADDEPIFVLRAQDLTADRYVDEWATAAAARLGVNHLKVMEAFECARQMRSWPTRKLPD